jgi:ppGpp synthetase/RelA/SpoT-type nucleotidyltranferase
LDRQGRLAYRIFVFGVIGDNMAITQRSSDGTDEDLYPKIPKSIRQYPTWLGKTFGYQIREGRAEYEALASKLYTTFAESPLWSDLSKSLQETHDRYRIKTGYDLFYSIDVPEIKRKPWESFLEKTYRLNFVKHSGDKSYRCPNDCYEIIDDVVRTCFVVKYLDGVDFLVSELKRISDARGIKNRVEIKANDSGYYAYHFYVLNAVDIPAIKGGMQTISAWVEIQVTTQLQEVLRTFLHTIYEKSRISVTPTVIPWQWRYKDDEFFTNCLGHMLHSIEGLIMEVRRRSEDKNAKV